MAARQDDVVRSIDGRATWESLPAPAASVTSLAIAPGTGELDRSSRRRRMASTVRPTPVRPGNACSPTAER